MIYDGENFYHIRDIDSTITQRSIERKDLHYAFRDNFFTQWLTREKKYFVNDLPLRDTIIDGNFMRYFSNKQENIQVHIGDSAHSKITDSLSLSNGSDKDLYYIDSHSNIIRQEHYFYYLKDTQITISIFKDI
jgi:hypothetical protein